MEQRGHRLDVDPGDDLLRDLRGPCDQHRDGGPHQHYDDGCHGVAGEQSEGQPRQGREDEPPENHGDAAQFEVGGKRDTGEGGGEQVRNSGDDQRPAGGGERQPHGHDGLRGQHPAAARVEGERDGGLPPGELAADEQNRGRHDDPRPRDAGGGGDASEGDVSGRDECTAEAENRHQRRPERQQHLAGDRVGHLAGLDGDGAGQRQGRRGAGSGGEFGGAGQCHGDAFRASMGNGGG